MKKILLLTLIFYCLISFLVGCTNNLEPIPTVIPSPEIRYEIPIEVLRINSIKELATWLWQNYHYAKDETWSGLKNYPLTPAEFFRSEIKLTNGTIVTKLPRTADCEDYAALTAYLLQHLEYDAYVAIIPDYSQIGIAHMISYGVKDNECVVINSPFINNRYSSINEYMEKVHPDKTISIQMSIDNYLDYLYVTGHHKYWDEDIDDAPKCRGGICPVGE